MKRASIKFHGANRRGYSRVSSEGFAVNNCLYLKNRSERLVRNVTLFETNLCDSQDVETER